ncbi:MAG: hypothetical protein J5924_05585 [Bacteroidaceae bacterium]|jgi:hypothetical protein|nr:hypothetical protein [Bacteroidaceae bacterium]
MKENYQFRETEKENGKPTDARKDTTAADRERKAYVILFFSHFSVPLQA